MFDFAISQHKRHRPTRLVLASRVLSVLAHIGALTVLIENPGLLSTGMNRWLQQFPVIVSSPSVTGKESRIVTFMPSRMEEPSQATLQKYLHHFDSGTPPVRVRWGPNEIASLGVEKPVPAVKPVLGKEEPKPQGEASTADKAASPAGTAGGDPTKSGTSAAAMADAGTPGGKVVPLPPPDTAPKEVPKKTETASNVAPTSIPNSPAAPKPSTPPQAQSAQKVFQDQQQAIRSEGSGLFDTKGFPLGEYANAITERIKANWSIPSNLRRAQGHTTVIFYIDKNGQFTGLSIVGSSGSSSLDYAALSAVIGSNPFPPLPKGFPGDHIGAKFVFSYNERQ